MNKVLKVTGNIIGMYLLGWALLWIIAVVCGAPANLADWNLTIRVMTGLFVVPIISAGLVHVATELNS